MNGRQTDAWERRGEGGSGEGGDGDGGVGLETAAARNLLEH